MCLFMFTYFSQPGGGTEGGGGGSYHGIERRRVGFEKVEGRVFSSRMVCARELAELGLRPCAATSSRLKKATREVSHYA